MKMFDNSHPMGVKPVKLTNRHNLRCIHRKYIGGPHDGRVEQVPFERGQLLKQFVNKSEWDWRSTGTPKKTNHFYVLMEPPQKATEQGTYIYQYQPNFRPPVSEQKILPNRQDAK